MLKKIASTLSVLITSMTLSGSMGYSLKASAESSFEDYLYYTLIDEDEDDTYDYASITGCRSLTQTAIIPSEIEGVPVTEISEDAFRYCYYLESVVIPETVETIEDRAFAYCYNLRDVTMPEAKLGTDVFFNTPYLENKAYDGISLNVTQLDSGKAVTLPKEIKLTDPSDRNSKQVYNPAQNGIYFINSKQIDFMSFSDGSYRNIFSTTPNIELAEAYMKKHGITPDEFEKRHSYPQVTNIYCNDEQVYILGLFDNFNPETYEYICEPVVTVYDLNKMEIEKIVFPDADISYYDYTAIGTDSQNRIYIAYSDYENNKSFIDLYSAEGQLIDSAETQYSINKFYGFDRTNGNFYFKAYDDSHGIEQICAANVSGGKIALSNTYISKYYLNESTVELIDGKYLCIDTPYMYSEKYEYAIESGLFVFNSNKLKINTPESAFIAGFERKYPEITVDSDGYEYTTIDSGSIVGTRAIPYKDRLVISHNLSQLSEVDPAGKVFQSLTLSNNILSLLNGDDCIYAFEKDRSDNFYIQKMQWKPDESIILDKEEATIKVGGTVKVSPVDDETVTNYYSWSSLNPNIASVSQDGEIFAYNIGETVISVKNAYGIIADVVVTVKASSAGSGKIYNTTGTQSYNRGDNNYGWNWANPVKSYFHENDDGSYTRLEYTWDKIIVENYVDGKLKSTKKLNPELDYFGGAFIGEKYNFLIFGQSNPDEKDSVEVIRIVRYSKSWNRMEYASVRGADTSDPFAAGSLKMTECDGMLYIHTSHKMYKSGDGLNHQSNMSLIVDQEYMQMNNSPQVTNFNYTSHSFNQFIKTDGKHIYTADHGDAYDRGIVLSRSPVSDNDDYSGYAGIMPFEFSGQTGDNYTGAEVGGFEIGKTNCIVAFNTINQQSSSSSQRNIKLAITDKSMTSSKIVNITNYSEKSDISVGNPQLVKINDNTFLLMWEEYKNDAETVSVVTIDENGKMISDIQKTFMLKMSDCQPVYCSDGLVRWYVTEDSSPVIYAVNPFELDKLFSNQSGKRGDANLDGKINVRDCALIASALATSAADSLPKTADYNNDGKINVRDAAAIAKMLASN